MAADRHHHGPGGLAHHTGSHLFRFGVGLDFRVVRVNPFYPGNRAGDFLCNTEKQTNLHVSGNLRIFPSPGDLGKTLLNEKPVVFVMKKE